MTTAHVCWLRCVHLLLSNTSQWNPVFAAQRLERIDRDLEQLRPRESTILSRRREVRLQTYETVVSTLMQINQDRLDLPITLSRGHDLAALELGVLDMNMHRVRLERRPIVQRM